MMINQSVLQNKILGSALDASSTLRPLRRKTKRSLVFTLTLTSLIDAFSILVIYLLINFANPATTIPYSKNIVLPTATQSVDLDRGTVVTIDQGRYFIENTEVSPNDLTKRLLSISPKTSLILQADRRADYTSLSPVIAAASQAGFQNFKFAVVEGRGR